MRLRTVLNIDLPCYLPLTSPSGVWLGPIEVEQGIDDGVKG